MPLMAELPMSGSRVQGRILPLGTRQSPLNMVALWCRGEREGNSKSEDPKTSWRRNRKVLKEEVGQHG
jgi:hypothetical protein